MTDYLEEHLENAEALLEQVRQMEREVPGLPREYRQEPEKTGRAKASGQDSGGAGEPEPEESEQKEAVDNLKERVDRMEKVAYDLEAGSEEQGEELEQIVNRPGTEGDNSLNTVGHPERAEEPGGAEAVPEELRTNEEKAAKNSSPLAARLEELDRAVSALAAGTPERQAVSPGFRSGVRISAGYPGITGTAGQSREGEGRSALPLSLPGEELDWAERADRVFRRDSRRYDGGFYLY